MIISEFLNVERTGGASARTGSSCEGMPGLEGRVLFDQTPIKRQVEIWEIPGVAHGGSQYWRGKGGLA